MSTSCEIALGSVPKNTFDDKSTQAITWTHVHQNWWCHNHIEFCELYSTRANANVVFVPINRHVAQIPQCTNPIFHNAQFCNRNVQVCTFLLKMVYCGKFVWCIAGFVRWVYCVIMIPLYVTFSQGESMLCADNSVMNCNLSGRNCVILRLRLQ